VKSSTFDTELTTERIKYFNFKEDFVKFSLDPLQIKNRIEAIKNNNPQLYQQYQ